MRGASGLRAVWAGLVVGGIFLFSGCARAPVVLEEEEARTEVEVGSTAPVVPAAPRAETMLAEPTFDTNTLQVREIKVVADNGQQGIFAKLTRPPESVTHFTLVMLKCRI